MYKSRLTSRLYYIRYILNRCAIKVRSINYRRYLTKHASVSMLAAVIVGSSIIDTGSNDANLALLFPPPPDVTTNIIQDTNQYFNMDNINAEDVSLKLANLDEHDIIQNQPLIMVADDASPLGGAGIIYTVQSGDSYSKIAANFGLNVSSILAANNIDLAKIKKNTKTLDIREGDKINIPFENIDGPGWQDVIGAIQDAKNAAIAVNNKSKTTAKKYKSKFLGSISGRDYGTYSGFTAGWCTAYAAKVRPDIANAVRSAGGGNAGRWGVAAKSAGLKVDLSPTPGSLFGTGETKFGHVGKIEKVNGDTVTVTEYNGPAGRGVLGRREISKSMLKFVIH